MKHEKIKEIIKDKLGNITDLSGQIGVDFDKDIIHDFRLHTKTLRSFLRLLRFHTKRTELKMSRRFKRLYHISGAIRDTQIELEKVADSKVILSEYINKLQHILSTQKKEWRKHYDKHIFKKLESKLVNVKYETLHPLILENFFTGKFAIADKISSTKSPTDEQIHQIRKEVKDILYLSGIAEKKWKGAKKQLKVLPVKELKQIADIVGSYNDKRILMGHLSSFSSPGMDIKEINFIKKITSKEKAKLEKEKKSIIVLVKELIAAMKK